MDIKLSSVRVCYESSQKRWAVNLLYYDSIDKIIFTCKENSVSEAKSWARRLGVPLYIYKKNGDFQRAYDYGRDERQAKIIKKLTRWI